MKNLYDIIIVGGGASGMMAAVHSNGKIGIIEKNQILGKKISATGNGRCNISNSECKYESDFGNKILSIFGVDKTLEILNKMGIITVNEGTRIYPCSFEAKGVREILEKHALKKAEHIVDTVKEIKIKKNIFNEIDIENIFEIITEKQTIYSKTVIMAAGGKAAPQYGLTGEGLRILKSMGHSIVKPIPALVPIMTDCAELEKLAGVRVNGTVTLYKDGKGIAKEKGQIQFNKDSISGICTFDLSMYIRGIYDHKYCVKIDFLDFLDKKQAVDFLCRRKDMIDFDEDFLKGLLPEKIGRFIMNKFNQETAARIRKEEKDLKKKMEILMLLLKEMEFNVTGTKGWKDAQVTAGGIDTNEILHTMESKLISGLFIAGEIIDVTGRCGGYNLQWAFSTGAIAGENASKYAENQRY